MTPRIARTIAWFLVIVYIALSSAGLYLQMLTNNTPANNPIPLLYYFIAVIVVGIWPIIGAQIISRHPRHPVGWLLFVTFPLVAIVMFAIGYASYVVSLAPGLLPIPGVILFWLKGPGLSFVIVTLTIMYLLFPTGKLLSPRWRPSVWLSIGALLVIVALLMVRPGPLHLFPDLDNPDAVSDAVWGVLTPLYLAANALLMLCSLAALVSLFLRLRQAEGDEAQQLKWLVVPAVAYWIGIPIGFLGEFDPGGTFQNLSVVLHLISVPAIVIAVAVAILKYRLYDIDIILNRTLVYGALTAVIIAIYILIVGALSVLFQAQSNPIIALLATGLVAILFQPLRERLQKTVNRLFYGRRDNPMIALSQLGKRLEAAIAPEVVLPTLVETIAHTLKLPYVAVSLRHGDDFKIAAQVGDKSVNVHSWPLIYQGETIGYLITGLHGLGKTLNQADRQLLESIAQQAGAAAYAVQLTQALRQSRMHLVTAREEERRRLRRDLHDGLGPLLASQGLKMAAVSQLLQTDPVRARQLLEDLAAQNETTVAEIRRLVYELRPAALDDLGLLGALRDYVAGLKVGAWDATNPPVEIQAPATGLPPLPAAIEVAAYRIITEALTNADRHAHAHKVSVCIAPVTENEVRKLHLEIIDDGVGLSADHRTGIGLISMRERAEEIGGKFCINSSRQGVRVVADLPLVETT